MQQQENTRGLETPIDLDLKPTPLPSGRVTLSKSLHLLGLFMGNESIAPTYV